MHWLTVIAVALIVARAAIQAWLASRQIAALERARASVPAAFAADISAADHAKASDYAVARLRAARVGALVEATALWLLSVGGGIAAIDAGWRTTALEDPWLGTAVVLSVLAVLQAVALPFAVWRTFVLEARFGFNRTTPSLFAADLAKRTLLGAALAAPAVAVLLVLARDGVSAWWIGAWLAWLAATFALTWAWPRFVAPWFNRFAPLEDAALRARIERVLERCGFASSGVFVMDGSRRSAHGNAYFTGVGRHKRIVFLDTLLQRLAPAEVEAVLAHELGHFRLRHVGRRLAVGALLALAGFALLARAIAEPSLQAALGVPAPAAHAALALCLVLAPVAMFFLRPLAAWRSRRDERQADDFAVDHTSAADLAEALVKIYRGNAASLVSDPLYSAFYDTHPPPRVRVARLKARGDRRGA